MDTVPSSGPRLMSMACDICSVCTTTANEDGVSPSEKWHRVPCSLDGIQPFGTIGHMRLGARGLKLAPWGERCVMLGMVYNHPSGIYGVKNLKIREIMCRQGVT